MKALIGLLILAALGACGKKGELMPPPGYDERVSLPGYGESDLVQERLVRETRPVDDRPQDQPDGQTAPQDERHAPPER